MHAIDQGEGGEQGDVLIPLPLLGCSCTAHQPERTTCCRLRPDCGRAGAPSSRSRLTTCRMPQLLYPWYWADSDCAALFVRARAHSGPPRRTVQTWRINATLLWQLCWHLDGGTDTHHLSTAVLAAGAHEGGQGFEVPSWPALAMGHRPLLNLDEFETDATKGGRGQHDMRLFQSGNVTSVPR